ncbi:hypothetical protein [Streptomyces tagetis]|uniref:Integral membrane protein n=1 Tax=Streptomyces tagetis TaxID=2820809 RepID=A0A940XQ30_9ACTN|nr:hypothetical protein [Streptomyces sp. RG38]MBQ0828980.1 hypothetical protein [Streptomyces sp. RG38]
MSKRQTQKLLRMMAGGEPIELTSPMASVRKLARLACLAQQFGYEYADVRQGSGRNAALTMLLVPDPAPQARSRAVQNWAQYPNAHDGVSLPPLAPDAVELLKARINYDLTGKNAEKRMGYGAVGVTVGCVILALRAGGDGGAFAMAGIIWFLVVALLGVGLVVTRKRNAKFGARLHASGFRPVPDETGRVRYLPPGPRPAGQGNPFAGASGPGGPHGHQAPAAAPAQGYGHPAPAPYPPQAPGGYPNAPQMPDGYPSAPQAPVGYPNAPQAPVGYPSTPQAPGGYPNAPQAPGGYPAAPQAPAPQAPGPYGQPQPGPYAPGPYAPQPYPPQQQPYPQQPYGQPPAQPPHPQQPLQQNPHWQPQPPQG